MLGYDIRRLPICTEFNGQAIRNIKDLKDKVEAVRSFHYFYLYCTAFYFSFSLIWERLLFAGARWLFGV